MAAGKIKEFLDSKGIKYIIISHAPAYTAQEIAALAHIPGREMAKTVIVKVDGDLAMAVIPASYVVDFERLKAAAGASEVKLSSEDEFKSRFAECEVGAMPPFGNLYDMPVWVDRALTQDQEIAFNAGSHKELFRMAYGDFEKLVKPKVAEFATRSA
jgi:Ala-tRNA(Pro) deacylase